MSEEKRRRMEERREMEKRRRMEEERIGKERLGPAHPHSHLSHRANEIIHQKDTKSWMLEWLEWVLKTPADESPTIPNQGNPFEYKSGKAYSSEPSLEGEEEGVYFLAAPMYGSGNNSYSNNYEVIPLGEWHLFFAPFVTYNTQLEYPSLTEPELLELAEKNTNSIYRLEVLVDGLSVECFRVQITPKDDLTINGIPAKNILGVEERELEDIKDVKIMADGYAAFLNPLSPGMHILSYRSYTPTYTLDTQVQLNVRGPKTKPTSPNS